jgi:hypothetical protein
MNVIITLFQAQFQNNIMWLASQVANFYKIVSASSHRGVGGRQKWPWDRFFSNYLTLSCHCHCTNAAYSFRHPSPVVYNISSLLLLCNILKKLCSIHYCIVCYAVWSSCYCHNEFVTYKN